MTDWTAINTTDQYILKLESEANVHWAPEKMFMLHAAIFTFLIVNPAIVPNEFESAQLILGLICIALTHRYSWFDRAFRRFEYKLVQI